MKPTTGGGIYYGLLCANIAADSLHQGFLANDLTASRLSCYQKKWQARLGKELRIGYWAHRLYQRLGNQQIERFYDFANNSGILQLIVNSQDFSFDWHGGLILNILKHLAVSVPVQTVKAISRCNTVMDN